jgi:AcrR family transcriptional regulator
MTAEHTPPGTRKARLRQASQERRDQLKHDVRQAILDASTILFLERGYQGFSLRQVAERIGYSPGTIYLYFADKDAIVQAIMAQGASYFAQMLTGAAQTDNPQERLRAIGRAYIDFGLTYPAHFQLMFLQRPDILVPADAAALPETAALFDLWQTAVQQAMDAGVIPAGDARSIGDAYWALLHGVVAIAILMPLFDEARKQGMIEAALRLLTDSGRPAGPP